MDVGKLPNLVNIVLCVWLFSLVCVFSIFLFLTGWEFGLIPYTKAYKRHFIAIVTKTDRHNHNKSFYFLQGFVPSYYRFIKVWFEELNKATTIKRVVVELVRDTRFVRRWNLLQELVQLAIGAKLPYSRFYCR